MASYPFLEDVRVLELAQFASDSLGGLLADFGADVVKVEDRRRPDPVRHLGADAIGGPEGPGFNHLRWNRGKRSICLDLRSDADRDTFRELARRADVVVEGMRAGVLGRLGFGYEELVALNPSVVFCSLSGLGSTGPYATLGSHGHLYDAFAGLLSPEFDEEGRPRRPKARGVEVGIHAAGLFAAVGVLAAVVRARSTGRGAALEVASCDAAAAWMPGSVEVPLNRAQIVPRSDQTDGGAVGGWPRVEFYRTADGRVLSLQAMEDKFWVNFCREVGRPDLEMLGRSDDDSVKAQLWSELTAILESRTAAEWLDAFVRADIAGGPVNELDDLACDPHFVARDNVYMNDTTTGRVILVANPVRVRGMTFAPGPAPGLGQDGDRVLRDWLGADVDVDATRVTRRPGTNDERGGER